MQLEALKTKYQLKQGPKFELQPRDREILRCCYEQQFLMYEQIERFFSANNANRRILKLKQAGLLYSDKSAALLKQHLLRLTPAGLSIARGESPYDVPQSKKVDLLTLTHDRIVTDVRLRLRELWDGIWIPERALKDKYTRIPDGLFQFDDTGKTVAVEIENSTKGQARFLTIMNEWARAEGVHIVLYIATTKRVFEAINKLFSSAPHRPAFALVSYDAFMSTTALCHSPRGALDLFTRRTL